MTICGHLLFKDAAGGSQRLCERCLQVIDAIRHLLNSHDKFSLNLASNSQHMSTLSLHVQNHPSLEQALQSRGWPSYLVQVLDWQGDVF